MTRKSDRNRFPTIIVLDNYNNKSYALKGNTLLPLGKPSFANSNFYTVSLPNKNIIIAPIEISAEIDDNDLNSTIEYQAYEELSLDPAREYIIRHIEIDPGGRGGRKFQLFVIEKEKYREIFGYLRKQVKYIDLIIPAPLLYRSLYDAEVIPPKGMQVFLYFSHHDTFVTFYNNGRYLFSKSIPFSLKQIHTRYCEMVGEEISEEKFYDNLLQDRQKIPHSDLHQNFMELFNEIFISINDIIIYTKRAYGIETIDQIFIGSDIGKISQLYGYAEDHLGYHPTPLEFGSKNHPEGSYIDQMQYMLASIGRNYLEDRDERINFTLYHRPPTLLKRPVGQMIAMSAAGLVAALALPLYQYIGANINDMEARRIRDEEKELSKEVARYQRILAQKKEIYKKEKDISKDLSRRYSVSEKRLLNIYNKKVNYKMKSDQLISFGNDLSRFGVKTNNISSELDRYTISILAPSDKKITELIKGLSQKYHSNIRSIDIQTIDKDNFSPSYHGILEVDLR